MATLPHNPDLDQLRRQAKELVRGARAGDPAALARIGAVSGEVTLAVAQLAIAREYGMARWPALRAEVQARARGFGEVVEAFLAASVGYRVGRAARLLVEHPEIAEYSPATAVVLGDAERVKRALDSDPELVSRRDPRTGWTALHAVCASRWHLDPARAEGLLTVARLLLDAGADVNGLSANGRWAPLECAVTGANAERRNESIVALLLDRGAIVTDGNLYAAGFAGSWCVRLLLGHVADISEVAEMALGAPISSGDVDSVRLLLDAGADPRRYRDGDGRSVAVLAEALSAKAPIELIELLLSHGADVTTPSVDGRSAYRLAAALDRADVTDLLARFGAHDDRTTVDRLLGACRQGDRVTAMRSAAEHPGLPDELTTEEAATIVTAAEAGDTVAVALMLDVGIPIDTRNDGHGATALHVAAHSGNVPTVRLLLMRGADIEARDRVFDASPLAWAAVGSGEQPASAPDPDWEAVVRTLLDAGASTDGIVLERGEVSQPSAEVASLLRARDVPHR
ncbi:MAG: ankyrin repeat domain-containing protein [Solirubrobacteraceae bacterium]